MIKHSFDSEEKYNGLHQLSAQKLYPMQLEVLDH